MKPATLDFSLDPLIFTYDIIHDDLNLRNFALHLHLSAVLEMKIDLFYLLFNYLFVQTFAIKIENFFLNVLGRYINRFLKAKLLYRNFYNTVFLQELGFFQLRQ